MARTSTKRVSEEDVVYRSSPRVRQQRFPEREKNVRMRPQGLTKAPVVGSKVEPQQALKKRQVRFPVADSEDEQDSPEGPKSNVRRVKSIKDQKTLTQIPFLRREGTSMSSTGHSKKRKRGRRQDEPRAQTTITQMPLVRSFNSMDDTEDHLGYESQVLGDDDLYEVSAIESKSPPPVSTRSEPVADSEDDELEEVTNEFETLEDETGDLSPSMELGQEIVRPMTVKKSSQISSTGGLDTAAVSKSNLTRTPKRQRAFLIPSSQSPSSSPVTKDTEQATPKSHLIAKPASPVPQHEAVSEKRSNPRRSVRAPLQPVSASSSNIAMSPTKRRILAFQARMSEAIGRTSHGSQDGGIVRKKPLFVASSTKTSAWSSLGGDENEELQAFDGQLDVGIETQAELSSLSGGEKQPSQAPVANAMESPKSATPRPEPSNTSQRVNQTSPQTRASQISNVAPAVPPLIQGDSISQDEVSAQLLLETQAGLDRDGRRPAVVLDTQYEEELPISTPCIRSSQATTVGTSPVRPTQHSYPASQNRVFLVPSSPASRSRRHLDKAVGDRVKSFDTDTTAAKQDSSPSLRRPSSLGFESSPVLPGRSQFKPGYYDDCLDDEVISATQFLGESIPPPPMWSDD